MIFSSIVSAFADDESLIEQSIANDKDMVKTTMERLSGEIEEIVERSDELDSNEVSESAEEIKSLEKKESTDETEDEEEIESIEESNYEIVIDSSETIESTEKSESEK